MSRNRPLYASKRTSASLISCAWVLVGLLFFALSPKGKPNATYVAVKDDVNQPGLQDARLRRPSSYSTMFAGERAIDAVLFLTSLALHDPRAHVYISTNSDTYEWYLDHARVLFYHLNLHWTLALDKYDLRLGREEMTAAGTYTDFLMEKVVILEKALENHNDTLFLDADVVLLRPIFIPSSSVYQLGVSSHFMKASEGSKYGFFNAGMLWTNQYSLGKAWREATAVSHYFEQAAIEDLIKLYPYFEFGPEHNIGFWRAVHHEVSPDEFYRNLVLDNNTQEVLLENRTTSSIHSHILTRYPYESGNVFSETVVRLINTSTHPNYARIASVIQWVRRRGHATSQMVF